MTGGGGRHLLLQLGQADIHGRSTSLSHPLHVISNPPSHRLLRESLGLGSTGRTVLNMEMAASEAAALQRASINETENLLFRIECERRTYDWPQHCRESPV